MDIRIAESRGFTDDDWAGYSTAYNSVFKKNADPGYFRQKYLTTIDGTSYHALLEQGPYIAGSCTVSPYDYLYGTDRLRTGLAVDVFIQEQYRTDPYALHRMYRALRLYLIERGIDLVIAVPNDIAYPYWKYVVKWRDIGCIPYYAFPVRAANVLGLKRKFLNLASCTCFWLFSGIQAASVQLWNPMAREQHIRIDRASPVIEQQRYTAEHFRVVEQNRCFSYRIVNEDGVVAAYLIDFYSPHTLARDAKTLSSAVRHIAHEHIVDIIIFVGKLVMPQLQLLRIPLSREPKHLHLMVDILDHHDDSRAASVLDFANWDFGLFNYDVR